MMGFTTIDALGAKALLEKGEAILIDVREPVEFSNLSIENAILKPLSMISDSDISSDSPKKIIVQCRSGKRSQTACHQYSKAHPHIEFFNLDGGILAWQKAGFKTISKNKSKVLPLDRQVQLTVGSMVFLGVIFGYFFNPNFLIIPLFFGAGLMFAGLSGTCGLAMFLAKMPWNQVGNK